MPGVPVTDASEWQLSDRTKKANAALAGFGRTRRILVSDTLLSNYSDDEIEVILAHELAHQVHHDIWRGIVVQALIVTAGVLRRQPSDERRCAPRLGWQGVADVAGLPVLLLDGRASCRSCCCPRPTRSRGGWSARRTGSPSN